MSFIKRMNERRKDPFMLEKKLLEIIWESKPFNLKYRIIFKFKRNGVKLIND
jgi:hypothetical protein